MQYDDLNYPYTNRGLCWYDGAEVGVFPAPPGGEPQWGGLPHAQIEDVEVRVTEHGYELWMSCVSRGIAVLNVESAEPAGIENPLAVSGSGLEQNYPNPFRSSTRLAFTTTRPGRVRLAIHDVAGRLIRVVVEQDVPAGRHEFEWDGTTADGRRAAAGTYYYSLDGSVTPEERKLVILN
jgi:hypothetical protein